MTQMLNQRRRGAASIAETGRGAGSMAVMQSRRHRSQPVDPARLDELPFEELACRLALSQRRGADARTWKRMLAPDLVVRTHAALRRARDRNVGAVRKRRDEWEIYAADCVGKRVDAQRWRAEREDYEDWRRRAANFASAVERALQEVDRVLRKVVRGDDGEDARFYRRQLQSVAQAIYAHRAALEDGDVIAEDNDRQLWSALETVSVPHGPMSEPTSLMVMFDERFWS